MRTQTTEAGERKIGLTNDVSWVAVVREQVGSLHFGVVQIVVHKSRVVQIDRTEKVRFDRQTSLIQ